MKYCWKFIISSSSLFTFVIHHLAINVYNLDNLIEVEIRHLLQKKERAICKKKKWHNLVEASNKHTRVKHKQDLISPTKFFCFLFIYLHTILGKLGQESQPTLTQSYNILLRWSQLRLCSILGSIPTPNCTINIFVN